MSFATFTMLIYLKVFKININAKIVNYATAVELSKENVLLLE